jgi:hypothetical protein
MPAGAPAYREMHQCPTVRPSCMALIVRIDVDRPYGKTPFLRHVLSRIGSDIYCPKVEAWGYLRELEIILQMLNDAQVRSYVFFRRCTLPTKTVCDLMDKGGHVFGLHLENSRSFDTFVEEKAFLERYIGRQVFAVSKHGSGKYKYGLHHHAPYEPDKYIDWVRRSGMNVFLGNLEDPTLRPLEEKGLHVYPSAFWLEPSWRDTTRFTIDWLRDRAKSSDVVLLFHPDNALADPSLTEDLKLLLRSVETRLLT